MSEHFLKKLYLELTPKISARVRLYNNMEYPEFLYRVTTEVGERKWFNRIKWDIKFSFATAEIGEALEMWKAAVQAIQETRNEIQKLKGNGK